MSPSCIPERLKAAIFLLASISFLSACQTVSRAGQELEENLAVLEQGKVPPQARQYATLSYSDLEHRVVRSDPWARFELGRRLELGIGMSVDKVCAVYWYYAANSLAPDRWSGQTLTRGLPQARAAIRRLVSENPENGVTIDPRQSAYIAEGNRCAAPLRNREYFKTEPRPLPK